jgi:hypothetical protein
MIPAFPSPISTQRPKGTYKEKTVDTQKKRRKKRGIVKLELPNEKRNDIRCSCPDLNYDKREKKKGIEIGKARCANELVCPLHLDRKSWETPKKLCGSTKSTKQSPRPTSSSATVVQP